MSKQRQRARAEQEERQRAAQRAKTAQKKARGPENVRPQPARKPRPAAAGSKKRGKQPVYRQRRFPPLPLWLKLSLAVGWLAVQVVIWLTIESVGTRIALGIISLFALPLIVVLVRDPSRRTKR